MTPAPWRLNVDHIYKRAFIYTEGKPVRMQNGDIVRTAQPIAKVNPDGDLEGNVLALVESSGDNAHQWEANAYAMAAAPDMLVALEALIRVNETGEGDDAKGWATAMLNARAAVMKAKGVASCAGVG